MTPRSLLVAAALAAGTVIAGCSPDTSADPGMNPPSVSPAAGPTLAGSADPPLLAPGAALETLAGRRVYFAHQSVGGNVLGGVERLRAGHAGTRFRVLETRDPATVEGPAFIHFLAGRNADPASKNADFLAVLDARPARDGGIALLKYCYLDMRSTSDPATVFAEYKSTIAAVRARHPDVTIVHVTMPLTTVEGEGKAMLKRLLGRASSRDIARKRHQYNAMLLDEYAGHEPVFDLAALEATRPDGRRAAFRMDGDSIFTLAPEYTDDGGHLNARGQDLVAARFLGFLAALPPSRH